VPGLGLRLQVNRRGEARDLNTAHFVQLFAIVSRLAWGVGVWRLEELVGFGGLLCQLQELVMCDENPSLKKR